jgi:SAM-dependent methyltransferase
MNNYQYCADWAASQPGAGHARVLDYGCGAGQIVEALLDRGIDAHGCDVFYDGGDYSSQVPSALMGTRVRRMENGRIPFDDGFFDMVVNNMVMEHVPHMPGVLAEIARVLKPGGTVLSVFPDRGVWREGHSGIPLLHRFPKGSRLRVAYACALRLAGAGHFKQDLTPLRWSRRMCQWLDDWTHYRTAAEIEADYGRAIGAPRYIEEDWLAKRAGHGHPVLGLPLALQRLIVRKLATRVFESRKQS